MSSTLTCFYCKAPALYQPEHKEPICEDCMTCLSVDYLNDDDLYDEDLQSEIQMLINPTGCTQPKFFD